ncbi:HAMP domain-containing protein [Geobacter pelophilus]|uniref:histidine kinase n=1 Tax=Geoanaerobacter pelophilus TaxID=60036 RepID=A0AAW4KY74_9BACT|nr:ATP-binding protein [Geoanaerobacter pelophilus]MBT0663314.1 HAMP domain-containing protein [Geoanaerobacter pelophilus]
MTFSIRWKIFASFILLTAAMGGALYAYLVPTLERHLLTDLSDHLFSQAGIAAVAVSNETGELSHYAPRLAAEIGRQSKARVTIIAPDGRVAGDSQVSPDKLIDLENHKDRPEVIQALQTGQGSAIRYSTTLRSEMLYVAAPVNLHNTGIGTIRLALPLNSVDQLKMKLHVTLGLAILFAALIALALSSILSQLVYRPMRQISQLAGEIGAGQLSRRIQIRRDDEFGGLARVMNDMADRLQEQIHSLASERNRLDAILRCMGEGVMVTDNEGVMTLVNPAFCTLFEVQENISGRPLIEISRHPGLNDSFRSCLQKKSEHIQEITIEASSEKNVITYWVPLLDGDNVTGMVAVFHDITELKRLEKIRKDFVANVSHELRTPVTVIKGYSETLLGGVLTEDPERSQQFLSIILNHSERLAALISDLLSLSEMESGNFSLKLGPVDLGATIRHAAELLELKSVEKGVALKLGEIPAGTGILADQRRIEQVFFNLLDNGIKYTPAGGEVSINVASSDNNVTVTISDTGPGIPLPSLPRIFERFYRVDAARSREQGGTGLGLAIVKHIVQLHGGSISVDSPPGQGAIFRVILKKP